ncbi:uncharacterized protein [Ptychodera flava]|uniref:uncharacterized protein n=1 Tax=Ptychodera flava TaxID=63121 RepID=UPI00396A0331
MSDKGSMDLTSSTFVEQKFFIFETIPSEKNTSTFVERTLNSSIETIVEGQNDALTLCRNSDLGNDFCNLNPQEEVISCSSNNSIENTDGFEGNLTSCGDEIITSTPAKRRRYSAPMRRPTDVLQMPCCGDRCMETLSLNDITESEQAFKMSLNEIEQGHYILRQITQHSYTYHGKTRSKLIMNLVIHGRRVCEVAWCNVHDISHRRFTKYANQVKLGVTNISHGNRGKKRMQEKTSRAISWMRFHFERIGDFMPHKNIVRLPTFMKKCDLWELMKTQLMEKEFYSLLSYGYFCDIWRKHLPEFRTGKSSDFAECDDCAQIRNAISSASTDAERQNLLKVREIHERRVETERAVYHNAREKAVRQPDDLLVIIIDGMDQKKTYFPRLVREKKNTENLGKVPMHATGSLIHTNVPEGKLAVMRLDIHNFPHDSNMTINNIMWNLVDNIDRLSRQLHLQLDNCYRENKNRFLLSFASLLVEYDIFEEVVLNFLPVGHTHEDIDQMFSRVSTALKKTNSFTMQELMHNVHESYTPAIKVQEVKYMFNVKEWLQPYMAGRFGGHSKPHNFRIRKINGRARMHYRLWSTDAWQPTYEEDGEPAQGLVCLETVPDVDDVPDMVEPSLLKLDLQKLTHDIPNKYVDYMPQQTVEHLRDFMGNIEQYGQVAEQADEWPLQQLIEAARRQRSARVTTSGDVPPNVQRIQDWMESVCPPVIVGNQGTKQPKLRLWRTFQR